MEIVSGAISHLILEITKYVCGPAERRVRCFFNHESNVQNLKDHVEKLPALRERVQRSADSATRNGELIELDVRTWLSNVDQKISTEYAEQLRTDEDKAKQRCFIGLCPRFIMSRYKLSKRAKTETKAIAELIAEADKKFITPGVIAYLPDPQLMVATSSPKGFESFKSREVVLQNILNALKDPNIQKIGLYGMGGVGKTMLTKEVAAIAKRDNLFDEVAIVTISNSQKTDIGSIQGEIADALGLKFEEGSDSGRGNRLHRRLNNGKKILVILDDIWKKVDLEAGGIIFAQNQNTCKLLLTSRSRDTLCIHMNIETIFELTILSPEESMVLFTKVVGNKVEEPDYNSVAIDVVTKCAGLPVAISVIAKALKEKTIDIWKNALQQLKRANPTSIEGMETSVYSALKLSYEYLQHKPAQSLLLLCSLQPQGDILISDLIKYSWGMGFLKDVYTMEEARNNVTALVQTLIASTLLLSGENNTLVRMHDIVRDVCISIAAEDNQMFVIEEQACLENLLKSREFENCTALSLPYSDFHELPDVLNCPELQFFLFYCKDGSLKVSDAFFKKTKKLKVLRLTDMEFLPLPSWIIFLRNLRTLCLDYCNLQNMAIIGELKNLEVLSLSNSNIKELPMELENLSRLKSLDLSFCYWLEAIPVNLISSLYHLEELYMVKSFRRWNTEGNASLSELKHLSCLTVLEIEITDVKIVPKNLFSQNLERYKVFIGEGWGFDYVFERSRILKLDKYSGLGLEMLKKTEELYLHNMTGVISLLSKFPHLKDLYIENYSDLNPYLFYSLHGVAFLESVTLINLMNLEKICHGQLEACSFSRLKVIRVRDCRKIKSLFSFSVATKLHQLQEIEVLNCKKIVEIVNYIAEDNNDNVEVCPLRTLTMKNLPKLIKFCKERRRDSKGEEDIEEIIDLSSPSMLLFNHKGMLCCLENLKLMGINLENLEEFCSTNLTIIRIKECNYMKHLFSTSMARCLMQLKYLEVSQCRSMIEIIATGVKETKDVILFPNLDLLELDELPRLTRFSENLIEFSSLRELSIKNCQVLESFVSNAATLETLVRGELERNNSKEDGSFNIPTLFDERVSLPKLQRLKIDGLKSLRRIWQDHLSTESFNNINHFYLRGSDRLLNIFPVKMLERLQRLHYLEIVHCYSVIEIIECEEPNLRKSMTKFELPAVIQLSLHSLPKLKSFSCEAIECPSLRTVDVCFCDQVELAFCSKEYIRSGKPQEEESQQPLFWVNKIGFPGLEELSLVHNENLKRIWEGQLPSRCFPLLRLLKLSSIQERSLLHNSFLSFPSLEQLLVRYSSLDEVFQGEGPEIDGLPIAQLRDLCLDKLNELRCLWDEKLFRQVFHKLTGLHVYECHKLKQLMPSSLSFSSLVTLTICGCGGLITVLTHSTAKSLVHLTKIKVLHCDNIQEIIAKDEAKDGITFTQLKCVELYHLKNLESFCLGNYSIQFPSLDELTVTWCSKMKIFCQGAFKAPNLQRAKLNERHWSVNDGDLNIYIQLMYQTKKVGFDFFELPDLVEIWNTSHPETILDFKNCTNMNICNCRSSSLRYLLTPSMALCLVNLQTMKVKNCSMIEQVIAEDANETTIDKIIFPLLFELVVKSCSNLRSFCRGSYDFEFPSLTTLKVAACSKMVMFSKGQEKETFDERSENDNNLDKTMFEGFFSHKDNKITFPILKILKLQKIAAKAVWQGQHLQANSLVQLIRMSIADCEMIREIIACVPDEARESGIGFYQLKYLELSCLQSLESFCCEECCFGFPSLEEVIMKDCPNMRTFSGGETTTPKLQRLKLAEGEDVELYGGSLNTTIEKFFSKKCMGW